MPTPSFEFIDTAAVSDALDSLGIAGHLAGIAARTPGARLIGPAYTVRYRPVRENTGFKNAANYIDDVPAGAVIVVDNSGRTDCTTWGGLLTTVAQLRGIAGTIVHGTARDIAEIRDGGYPLFSTAVGMVSGKNRVELDQVNVPVRVGDVQVAPGDIIVADDSGALRVPAAVAEEILGRAARVDGTERRIGDAVAAGQRLDRARAAFGYAHPWEDVARS